MLNPSRWRRRKPSRSITRPVESLWDSRYWSWRCHSLLPFTCAQPIVSQFRSWDNNPGDGFNQLRLAGEWSAPCQLQQGSGAKSNPSVTRIRGIGTRIEPAGTKNGSRLPKNALLVSSFSDRKHQFPSPNLDFPSPKRQNPTSLASVLGTLAAEIASLDCIGRSS